MNSSTPPPAIGTDSRRSGTAGRFAEASSWCISNHVLRAAEGMKGKKRAMLLWPFPTLRAEHCDGAL
jgi:hypothetical protein